MFSNCYGLGNGNEGPRGRTEMVANDDDYFNGYFYGLISERTALKFLSQK